MFETKASREPSGEKDGERRADPRHARDRGLEVVRAGGRADQERARASEHGQDSEATILLQSKSSARTTTAGVEAPMDRIKLTPSSTDMSVSITSFSGSTTTSPT